MADPATALDALDFGRVDSESEPDLDRRFLRTEDFDSFLDDRNLLVLGAKGSGKSALFEMFSKHLDVTRKLAWERMERVVVGTGTGFGDLTELSTADIQSLGDGQDFQFENLWRVYIALKAALSIGQQGYSSNGPLRDFLRAAGEKRDYRIGPMLASVWELVGGSAPAELEVNFMGTGARIVSGKRSLDVNELLADVQDVLEKQGVRLWLLFDKIDELYATEPAKRRVALEGLFPAAMSIPRSFPSVVPRILIRSDIYGPELHFTNKSHLADKRFEIKWDIDGLRTLLVKRGTVEPAVRALIETRQLRDAEVEALDEGPLQDAFNVIFDERAYTGKKEAELLKWMIARATDAKGSTYPRELIAYGNLARENQLKTGGPGESSLITGRAVVDAYDEVSKLRCETFLSEFPELREHIKRFRGLHDSPFTRDELNDLFKDLDLNGQDAIDRLHDVGVLAPIKADIAVADDFEVPRLYRAGLGLQIKARP